ncbi:poly [ADP-ribose] polymerase tankyrase-like [Dreissena polymorpha]|uniref:MYND-type domain-containing protein n=1 Tax=Dreissena polymorpha TaxID=45954 RepID=A0A9D4GQI7_DREPO|nr:poly [ADP-ribose] polymerase tankyrase-like [Dreissena polymorpha]XP_052285715.1 poly [ADP-ribose] polymerase tankyrase-like [Dreissena polymorpha]XP_052285716.1 poly [ADP-ribose] polymerase tankyrase-like [Dreissena polymorpha]XP_052285717.1 poly [ADP-ribose] polymerase tankyrase-like [Dreissena polymorpha]KAH3819686.1 hypothetical protein DPMN_121429 [Dreissena polymorpha]
MTSKKVSEMSVEELEKYSHTPSTELSIMVGRAKERGEYGTLKDFLQKLSEQNPAKIHDVDSAGMTALHCAVAYSSLPAVILLLKYGAHVNAKDDLGFTPLFLATGRYANLDIAGHLIKEGKADINTRTKAGATALHGAVLMGKKDCVEVLLKHGADPRLEDDDGTTPFDLTKDKKLLSILHEHIAELDKQREESGAKCANCGKVGSEMKRCSQCHTALYCNKDCQIKHWTAGHKQDCLGFVTAKSTIKNGKIDDTQMCFYHVLGSTKKNVKMYCRKPTEAMEKMDILQNKRFIVKVQVPIGVNGGDMMVYNVDRSCQGFIHNTEKDYGKLLTRISKEGYMGIKAYFWAEICNTHTGDFKVFHSKTAPFQEW